MRRSLLAAFVAGVAVTAAVLSSVGALAASPIPARPIDGTAPTLRVDPISFVVGAAIDAVVPFDPEDCDPNAWHRAVPMRLSWSGADSDNPIGHYDVWAVPTYTVEYQVVSNSQQTSLDVLGGNYDSSCGGPSTNTAYRVEVTDRAENSAQAYGDSRADVGVWQEDGSTVPFATGGTVTTTRTGFWRVSSCLCFDAGATLYATAAGATAEFTVTPDHAGQWFAIVMPKNTNRGEVSITVDDGEPVVVDTYAASAQNRIIVWQTQLSRQTHVVTVTNLGTAGRSRIDLDAVLIS